MTGYLFGLVAMDIGGELQFVVASTEPLAIPLLSAIPIVGGALFSQHALGYLGILLIPITHVLLFRTGAGLHIRASGEFTEGARAVGVDVLRVRLAAMTVSGVLAAVGGAYFTLAHVHAFSAGLTGGRGFIALAIIILGRWTPVGILLASLLIGAAEAVQVHLQATGAIALPVQFALAFPYLVTLLAVAAWGKRVRPPAEEGRPLP